MSKKAWVHLGLGVVVIGGAFWLAITGMKGLFRRRTGAERPHIVFLLVDALRKDHLGCYGYERATTPTIDALSQKGLVFENAVSQAPWTSPSMASIFTSRYPSQVGVGALEDESGMRNLDVHLPSVLPKKALTLAERLKKAGYMTVSLVANPYIVDKFGMLQGFRKKFYEHKAPAGRLIERAVAFIDAAGPEPPLFLYVHLMDLHIPLEPPSPFDTLYPTLDGAPHTQDQREWKFFRSEDLASRDFRAYLSHKRALYDGSLNYLDFQIGRFMDFLRKKDRLSSTVVVIAADHGEEFWDHADSERRWFKDPRNLYGMGHGHTLFRELLDVPLILFGPGVPPGRIASQVRNVDIAPTLLDLAGVDVDPAHVEGVPLVEKITQDALKPLLAFSEDIAYGYEQKSLQNMAYKYIRTREREILFDKTADPTETRDIAHEKPEIVFAFRKSLDSLLELMTPSQRTPAIMDAELRERLKSLGYIK